MYKNLLNNTETSRHIDPIKCYMWIQTGLNPLLNKILLLTSKGRKMQVHNQHSIVYPKASCLGKNKEKVSYFLPTQQK